MSAMARSRSVAKMAIDLDEMRRGLAFQMSPGATHQLQILPSAARLIVTRVGEDLESVVSAVLGLANQRGADGVYVTLNPVSGDHDPKNAVKAADIVFRQLLMFDFDRAVGKDRNASDEDKALVWDVVQQAVKFLSSLGWAEPVIVDTGNGYHVLYLINLLNDEDSKWLVDAVIKKLAGEFDTDSVVVDRQVGSANRSTRLCGTWNKKFPNELDRPQRQVRLVSSPKLFNAVTPGQLEAYAGPRPPKPSPRPVSFNAAVANGREQEKLQRYAEQGINRELSDLSSAAEGGRNASLNKAAMAIGQLIHAVGWTYEYAASVLIDHGTALGLPEFEARATVRSGLDKGVAEPRDLSHVLESTRRHQAVPQWSCDSSTDGGGNGAATTPKGQGGEPGPEKPPAPEAVDDQDRLARLTLNSHYLYGRDLTLRHYNNEWLHYVDGAYQVVSREHVEAETYRCIKNDFDDRARKHFEQWDKKQRQIKEDAKKPENSGKPTVIPDPPVARKVPPGLIKSVMGATLSKVILPENTVQPCWLQGIGDPPFAAQDVLCTKNGLVSLPRLVDDLPDYFSPLSARYFSTYRVNYNFNLNAPEPYYWAKFLQSIFGDDHEACELLQEWFGLMLTQDTSYEKILTVIGPKRCGKGTIAKVIKGLVGDTNVANPTLASMVGDFGLASLYNKQVAIIPDARISRNLDAVAAGERLLNISGRDAQDINRKYLGTLNVKLPTRFVIFSNDMLQIPDASGALTGRYLVLRLTRSFYGKEDRGLADKLVEELPSILMWSILGWARLRKRGYFVQPESGKSMLQDMEDLGSPIGKFYRDCCREGGETAKPRLYARWVAWCKEEGRDHPGTQETFGKNLKSFRSNIENGQRRVPNAGGARENTYKGVQLIDDQWNES